jgi:streptomycin 6-kinase
VALKVALKVAWRHTEADHEADGLRVWDGAGAACLHRVERFGHSVALLSSSAAGPGRR